MKTKTLVLLLIILAVLVGAGTLVVRMKAPETPENEFGRNLFKDFPVNEITTMSVKVSLESVSLAKEDNQWVVKDRFDYPADFNKIADFVRQLKDLKIGRSFEGSEDTLKRLALKEPDDAEARIEEKGKVVQLKDEKGESLARILLGQIRKGGEERTFPGGQYLKLDADPKIYLVDKHFSLLHSGPADWLEKDLLKVLAKDIRQITCLSADAKTVHYTLQRPEKGQDMVLKDPPKGRKVDKTKLNKVANALSQLSMDDVEKPSATETSAKAPWFEYRLFDGMIYRVYPEKAPKEKDRYLLRLSVDYRKPPEDKKKTEEAEKTETEKTDKKEAEKSPEEMALEAEKQHKRLSPWVFVIPQWKHGAFLTDAQELLEEVKKDKPKS